MAATRKGIVYTLTDPRDGAIRYVGKTINAPLDRLAQHLSSPTNPAMRVWFASLGGQGLFPRMEIIATVAGDKLVGEENRQIEKHAREGHRLLNSPYYRTNLADLFDHEGPIGEARKNTLRGAAVRVSVNALCDRLYRRTAAGHVSGGLPTYAVVARTMLIAPVLAVGILVLMLTKTRPGRRCLAISMLGGYAWDIGFDHAIKSLVLPHLPVDAAVRFWHEYLAHPVGVLGLHLAIVLLLASWGAYTAVAEQEKERQPKRRRQASRAMSTKEAAAATLDDAVLHGVQPSPLVASLTAPKVRI